VLGAGDLIDWSAGLNLEKAFGAFLFEPGMKPDPADDPKFIRLQVSHVRRQPFITVNISSKGSPKTISNMEHVIKERKARISLQLYPDLDMKLALSLQLLGVPLT